MKIEDIRNLLNVSVEETNYYVYITPNIDWYLEVEDIPENDIYYDTVEMLKQDEYPNIQVLCMIPDPSQNF